MTVRGIQWWLASVFFGLGGWCLLSPGSVLALTITPAYRSNAPIVPILMGAFGAQALIAGLFAAFSRFERRTFLAYGIGLLPFFGFDYWFYAIEPMLTPLGLLDGVGNVVMLAACVAGWRAAGAETARGPGAGIAAAERLRAGASCIGRPYPTSQPSQPGSQMENGHQRVHRRHARE